VLKCINSGINTHLFLTHTYIPKYIHVYKRRYINTYMYAYNKHESDKQFGSSSIGFPNNTRSTIVICCNLASAWKEILLCGRCRLPKTVKLSRPSKWSIWDQTAQYIFEKISWVLFAKMQQRMDEECKIINKFDRNIFIHMLKYFRPKKLISTSVDTSMPRYAHNVQTWLLDASMFHNSLFRERFCNPWI
jgi:hypothetical protein